MRVLGAATGCDARTIKRQRVKVRWTHADARLLPRFRRPVTHRPAPAAAHGAVAPSRAAPGHGLSAAGGGGAAQFTTPVEVRWDAMDPELLRRFWARHAGERAAAADISDHVLVFHRGMSDARAPAPPAPGTCLRANAGALSRSSARTRKAAREGQPGAQRAC